MNKTAKNTPRNANANRKKASAQNNKEKVKSASLFGIAAPFIILAVSLIVETCLILEESAGELGTLIHNLFFGLFGYAAHVVAISGILIAFFFKDLRERGTLRFKCIIAGALCVAAAALNSLAAQNGMSGARLSFAQFWSSGVLGESGGVFGGFFGLILSKLITPVAAVAVAIAAALALFSFSLGKSRLGIWRLFIRSESSATRGAKAHKSPVKAPEQTEAATKSAPALPEGIAASQRIDTVIGESEDTVYPELSGGEPYVTDFDGDFAGDGSEFSISDGRHTIETVNFDESEEPAKPYKPADLMEEFGFKEAEKPRSDVYDEAPRQEPQKKPRKISVSGARGYSPFATVVSEEEFFGDAGKSAGAQPSDTEKKETRAYSPFSDPVRSMNEPKRDSSSLPPQAYVANDASEVWENMQRQASTLESESDTKPDSEPMPSEAPTPSEEFAPPTPFPFAESEPIYEPALSEQKAPAFRIPTDTEQTEAPYVAEPSEHKVTPQSISDLNTTGSSAFDEDIQTPEQEEEIPARPPEQQRPASSAYATPSQKPSAPKNEENDHSINPFSVYNKLRYPKYVKPPTDLLDPPDGTVGVSENEIYETQKKLLEILHSFNIDATLTGYSVGPTITRYEITPGAGVKFKQIYNLSEDISVRLQSDKLKSGIRIVTVPGKSVIGVEVPNSVVKKVSLRSLIENPDFQKAKSKITVCIGQSVSGKPVYMNIDDMPHVLVAGQTKSGKSVAINCMIISLLYRASPDEVQFILIDPKRVELGIYNDIPHMVMPVIDDPKRAAAALKWAVAEMERRYQLLNDAQVRNRDEYYATRDQNPKFEYMPQIVIIIDELADLMLQVREHVEGLINRLAAMARACGMHIVIGTQRPSVDVVTGLIKANIPSHIAFKVSSHTDSRVILGNVGAEKLLGRGDMLYHPTGSDQIRAQGAFVDTPEIKRILSFIIEHNGKACYNPEVMYTLQNETDKLNKTDKKSGGDDDYAVDCADIDFELLCQATELIIQMGGGISKNVIQRHLKIGFNRAANIFEKLEELGFISGAQGNKPRDVTVTWEQYQQWRNNNGK